MATIEFKVTYDSKKESLEQVLANLLSAKPENNETYKQLSLFDKPETPAAPTMPDASAANPATEQTAGVKKAVADAPADPAPATQEEPKKISQADVRALAVALSKSNKPALKAIFKELGVSSFSGVKEEDYPVFYEKLVAANG